MNIEELAKQSGMNVSMWNYGASSIAFTMGTEGVARGAVERFAALVAEECAKVCDELMAPTAYQLNERSVWDVATMSAGDAIRAKFKVTT